MILAVIIKNNWYFVGWLSQDLPVHTVPSIFNWLSCGILRVTCRPNMGSYGTVGGLWVLLPYKRASCTSQQFR